MRGVLEAYSAKSMHLRRFTRVKCVGCNRIAEGKRHTMHCTHDRCPLLYLAIPHYKPRVTENAEFPTLGVKANRQCSSSQLRMPIESGIQCGCLRFWRYERGIIGGNGRILCTHAPQNRLRPQVFHHISLHLAIVSSVPCM